MQTSTSASVSRDSGGCRYPLRHVPRSNLSVLLRISGDPTTPPLRGDMPQYLNARLISTALRSYRATVPSRSGTYTTAQARRLTVLALESSADDSCAAIVRSKRQVLSNVVIKQHHLNIKHGGIHPLEAQHAHERNVVGPFIFDNHAEDRVETMY